MPVSLEAVRARIQGMLYRAVASGLGKPTRSRAAAPGDSRTLNVVCPSDFDDLIAEASRRHGVDPSLIRAVIKVESNFNPQAMSSAGAKGLMQLMDATGEQLGVSDPFDARQNIEGGVAYLRQMLDRFNDLSLALAAYNAGPQAVEKHRGIPPYAETQMYVSRVQRVHRGICDQLA